MIRKEDIRRGLVFRACWDGEDAGVADITITDGESGEELPVRVPLRPFVFMVTDVYPRMGEVVVMGVERAGGACSSAGLHSGVRMVDGCLPVRLTVERFLRFFGGYEIVDGGAAAGTAPLSAKERGSVAGGACGGGDCASEDASGTVTDWHSEAERVARLACISSVDEYERIQEEIRCKDPYGYGLCRLCELSDGCVRGKWRGLLTGMHREWQRIRDAVMKPSCKRKDGGKEL